MATPAQVIANRENAKKSTGPKSEQGKARSCMNRLSHGFASTNRFVYGEKPEEFYALLSDLMDEHQPSTPTQQILVEKMADNQWISLRAICIQTNLMTEGPAEDFNKTLPLLIRYQTAADRAFHKCLEALIKLQKESKKSEIGFESKKADEADDAPQKAQTPPAQDPAASNFDSPEEEIAAKLGISVEELLRSA